MEWALRLSLLLMAFIVPQAWAQTVSISGRVLERGTKKALEGVNVFVLPQQLKGTTGKDGTFTVEGIQPGEVEVIINFTNYDRFQSKLKLDRSLSNQRFFLNRAQANYFETTITDTRNRRDDTEKRLKQDEFLTLPGSNGDPVKAVQNLPGVSRVASGDSRIVVQGSEPEDTRYNIEGHEVPLIFHFGGLSSIVTPEAVDSVNYLSAGYGPEFGRALGGHVGLTVRKPKLDRMQGMAFADIFNLGGLIEGPISETSGYMVSGRYSYVGEVIKQIAKDNENFDLTVAPVFFDLNGQYYKRLNARDEFRLFSIVSRDRLEFVLSRPINNDPTLRGNFEQTTFFYRVIPQWTRQIDEKRKLNASLGYGSNDISFDVETNYFRLRSNTLSVRGDFENRVSTRYTYNLGVDNIYTWFNVDVRVPDTFEEGGVSNPLATGDLRDAEVTGKDNFLGLYFRNEIKPVEDSRWTFLPSIRLGRFARIDENVIEPRLAIRFQPNDSLTYRFASGLYHQGPSGEQGDRTFGNPDIRAQRTQHYSLGVEKDFRENRTEGVTASLTGFYKTLDRLIVASNDLVERDGALTPENYNNSGTGRIYGFETQLKRRSDAWTLIASYTYLQSRRQQLGQPELPSPFDQTHSLNLLTSYTRGVWLYGARFRYVTGNPFTPIVGGSYDSDNDVYVPQRGELYSSRESAFYQLDIRIDRKFINDTYILSGYLDIQNVTGRRNVEGRSYSYDYSQSSEVTGLPILPTIGVKGEF